MGPFGPIVRVATMAPCFDTLQTSTRVIDVRLKCGDVCYQNIDFWQQVKLQHRRLASILNGRTQS